jgi:hypothetical protein
VTFTATDDGNGTGTPQISVISVPISIRNANRAPVLPDIATQQVDQGTVLELPVVTTDPDGNPLTLTATVTKLTNALTQTLTVRPGFANFTDNGDGTGLFRFEPLTGDRGDYEISVTATDNGDGQGSLYALSETKQFILQALSPSEPPRLAPIGDKVALVGQKLSFLLKASDLDQDNLVFAVEAVSGTLPADMTITPQVTYGTALVEWRPAIANQPIGQRRRWRRADLCGQQPARRCQLRCGQRRAELDAEHLPVR